LKERYKCSEGGVNRKEAEETWEWEWETGHLKRLANIITAASFKNQDG
jgi:hypothetical protein